MISIQRAIVAGIALPPALALAVVLGIAAAERTGTTVFADVAPSNLAEAAAAGRGDDVVRRVRRGEPLHQVYSMRPEATHSPLTRATPAEAAVWSGQVLMVQLLEREGAIRPADRPDLACLALDLERHEIAGYLSPSGGGTCE